MQITLVSSDQLKVKGDPSEVAIFYTRAGDVLSMEHLNKYDVKGVYMDEDSPDKEFIVQVSNKNIETLIRVKDKIEEIMS